LKSVVKNGTLQFLNFETITLTIMKNTILVIAVVGCSIMLVNCSPSSEKKVEKVENEIEHDIKKEKDETVKDLQTLRDDLNTKLDKITKKLDGANATAQAELESVKEILIAHRTRVEEALSNLDNAADDSLDNIQQAAKNTSNEVKVECEKIAERFDNAVKDSNK
jgi:DNA-binding transcriptional MerR regulator